MKIILLDSFFIYIYRNFLGSRRKTKRNLPNKMSRTLFTDSQLER